MGRVGFMLACAGFFGLLLSPVVRADGPYLYGVHFWGLQTGQPVDNTPCQLLDCPTYGGWDLEVILTHGDFWAGAAYYVGNYQDLYQNKNISIVTRIDYNWGQTVPSPSNPDYAGWADAVLSAVNQLAPYCHLWVLGNEPNLNGEGNGWTNNQITPAGYATIYRAVRNKIQQSAQASPAGPHRVLVAPVSPGGIILGTRWMAGADWLSQTIDNIPAAEIDGFAVHSYGGTLSDFHNGYVEQLAVIDGKGQSSKPVYLTEFNRYATPGNAVEEAAAAQFCRDAFADVHAWNITPGNHNIVAMMWFVYDGTTTGAGAWDGYSLEYWKSNGNPAGSNSDLFTAFAQTVDLRYPAGLIGTRPNPPPVADFSAAPLWGEAPLAVQFTNLSTGTITTSQWNFGDGGSASGANPAHNFTTPGVYNVTLTVTGPGGTNAKTRTAYISVIAPQNCPQQRITAFEGHDPGAQVMFRAPRTSGSTSGHLATTPNVAAVTDEIACHDGSRCCKVQWAFVDNSTSRWLRLTTNAAANVPNPAIDLRRPVRVRLRLDSGSFRLALGIRETGIDVPIGNDGGTSGTIEWIDATGAVSGAPQGVLVNAQPGVWQTFVFYPGVDPVWPFTGDGVLSAANNKGVFEHLAIASTGSIGPFTLYLDAIDQLCFPRQDLNGDTFVDLADYGLFQRCLSGPGVAQNDPACQAAKLDNDNDVDDADLLLFRNCLTGPSHPTPVNCMY